MEAIEIKGMGKGSQVKMCDTQWELAVPASQDLSPSFCGSYLYPPNTMCPVFHMPCFSMALASAHASSQPESTEVATNCSTPPEVFWCVSLHGVPINLAQLCYMRQTSTCMLLAKNPSSHVLSHACLSRTSSPVFASAKHSFMTLP